jgi:cation:H+ antiporter
VARQVGFLVAACVLPITVPRRLDGKSQRSESDGQDVLSVLLDKSFPSRRQVSMILFLLAIVFGFALLIWSANLFVDGAAATARNFGMPPLLIGMVVVGFGTSAPEMIVSVLAALQGTPGIALGNAYGSNIGNIALILGTTAVINPIAVHSRILRQEMPMLLAVTALAAWQLRDAEVSRLDAIILVSIFAGLMFWTVRQGLREKGDALGREVEAELAGLGMSPRRALFLLVAGLVLLVVSSRVLVWGAVGIARALGVDDLIIGLTVVAAGTSLPELASSIIAARKGEHDIALGNIIGSNFFNTLAVVGIAGLLGPMTAGPEIFSRDMAVMGGVTVLLFVFGYGFRGPGRINRFEGLALVGVYVAYSGWLVSGVLRG